VQTSKALATLAAALWHPAPASREPCHRATPFHRQRPSPFHPPGSWIAEQSMPWWMKGRGAVAGSAPALSERSEDILHRSREPGGRFHRPP